MAEKISIASLGNIWQVLFKGFQELQYNSHSFQHGEMLIIRLIYLYDGPSPNDLVKKIEKKLEQKSPSNFSNNETITNEIPKTVNKLNLQNDIKKENKISAVSSNFFNKII